METFNIIFLVIGHMPNLHLICAIPVLSVLSDMFESNVLNHAG